MFNPLSFNLGDQAIIEDKEYYLKNRLEFTLNTKSAVRYIFENSFKTIIIEVKKELALNYQLFLYENIEEFSYSNQFLSILGTNTLSYNNTKLSTESIYKKVKVKNEQYQLVKHIVEEDELPKNYEDIGYYKDENNLLYFFTKKYTPNTRIYKNSKKESWEYKQDDNIRLFIEACKNSNLISVYKGKEIRKSDIKNISTFKSSTINTLYNRNFY